MIRVKNTQDFWAGVLFLVVGLLALWFGRPYTFGTATKMGPGYLPTVLSWMLVLIGAFLSLRALRESGPPLEASLFRPQFSILLAIVIFAFLIENTGFLHLLLQNFGLDPTRVIGSGLVPAVVVATVVAASASREMRWVETLVLAAGLAALCVALFVYLLGQPLTIWSWGF